MGIEAGDLPALGTIASAVLIGMVAAIPAQIFMARYAARYSFAILVPVYGLVGALTCLGTNAEPHALVMLFASLLLLTGALTDWKVRRLPDLLTGAFFLYAMSASIIGYGPNPLDALIGAAIGFGSLLALNLLYQLLRGRNGIGGGDIKLAAALGALTALPDIVLVLAGGAILHSLIGLGLIAARRGSLASELPFGPALSLVTWLLLLTAPPVTA
ncbi:MAG: prepilin peptidase [Alphaproteobacteria bacterium]